MGNCKKCGEPINNKYIYCYKCNKQSKTYKDSNGYERYKDSDILVHRHIAEKKLKRELDPEEDVHHKDRNKTNNKPSNLWVFENQEEHDRIHEEDSYNHGPKASYKGFANRKKVPVKEKKKSLWEIFFH